MRRAQEDYDVTYEYGAENASPAYYSASKALDQQDITTQLPGEKSSFPLALYEMLQEAEVKGFDHIVSWNPSGDGFRVHNPKAFAEHIAPLYFHCKQWKSFQKQCSLYQLEGIKQRGGHLIDSYRHPFLVRGKPVSVMLIRKPSQAQAPAARLPRQKSCPPVFAGTHLDDMHDDDEEDQDERYYDRSKKRNALLQPALKRHLTVPATITIRSSPEGGRLSRNNSFDGSMDNSSISSKLTNRSKLSSSCMQITNLDTLNAGYSHVDYHTSRGHGAFTAVTNEDSRSRPSVRYEEPLQRPSAATGPQRPRALGDRHRASTAETCKRHNFSANMLSRHQGLPEAVPEGYRPVNEPGQDERGRPFSPENHQDVRPRKVVRAVTEEPTHLYNRMAAYDRRGTNVDKRVTITEEDDRVYASTAPRREEFSEQVDEGYRGSPATPEYYDDEMARPCSMDIESTRFLTVAPQQTHLPQAQHAAMAQGPKVAPQSNEQQNQALASAKESNYPMNITIDVPKAAPTVDQPQVKVSTNPGIPTGDSKPSASKKGDDLSQNVVANTAPAQAKGSQTANASPAKPSHRDLARPGIIQRTSTLDTANIEEVLNSKSDGWSVGSFTTEAPADPIQFNDDSLNWNVLNNSLLQQTDTEEEADMTLLNALLQE